MPEFNSKSKKDFIKIKNYLKCTNIKQKYYREKSTKSGDYLSFSVIIYDVKRENANLDSLNNVIFDIYESNNYELKKCDKINIYYFRNHSMAKLRKAYIFDGNRNLIEIAYH